jgi:hypothetical protein
MDSDMHVFEPADLWQRYIHPKYAERAPVGLNRSFRDLGIEVEGKILPIPRNPENPALAQYRQDFFQEKYGDAGERNFDGISQVMAMDKEGLDVAVLFPTRGYVSWALTVSIRSSRRPSRAPTTIGSMISPRPRRTACMASP